MSARASGLTLAVCEGNRNAVEDPIFKIEPRDRFAVRRTIFVIGGADQREFFQVTASIPAGSFDRE
jgi:hypothetical protein